jgi:hypothetical protein
MWHLLPVTKLVSGCWSGALRGVCDFSCVCVTHIQWCLYVCVCVLSPLLITLTLTSFIYHIKENVYGVLFRICDAFRPL